MILNIRSQNSPNTAIAAHENAGFYGQNGAPSRQGAYRASCYLYDPINFHETFFSPE